MTMRVTKTAGGDNYASPFVSPVERTTAIDVNIAALTAYEVDANGRIKPGVPLTKAGALVAALALSTIAQGTNAQGTAVSDTGNGVIGAALGGYGMPSETITATFTTTGATAHADVVGSKSGYIGQLIVGTAFVSPQIRVSVADGSTDFTAGNVISWVVTGGATDVLYGVTVEGEKLVDSNSDTDRTGTFSVTVATEGLLNRDVIEDTLGRALTATEVAAFAHSALQLTNT